MAFNVAALNAGANAIAALVTKVSLHSASPGTTGANKLTGGSPAYADKTPTYNTAAGGIADLNAGLVFDIPAGATVAYYGLWAGATFLEGKAVSSSESYTGQGVYTLNSAPVQVQ